jgi:Protein of unknown function (DUF4031)
MPVYVDDMCISSLGVYGRMRMSHMIADTSEELLEMADKIGVKRRWIQRPGTCWEHFDICKSKRAKAIQLGAKQLTMRQLVQKVRDRR